MQPVSAHFTERRFTYVQLRRQGMVALYQQTHNEGGAVRYEVVRLRVQPERTWPDGHVTPEREAYPGATAWGRDGFTCFTLEEATEVMTRLLATQGSGLLPEETAHADLS